MPACSFLNPTGTETFIKLKNPDSNHTDTHTHTDLKQHGKDRGPTRQSDHCGKASILHAFEGRADGDSLRVCPPA